MSTNERENFVIELRDVNTIKDLLEKPIKKLIKML